VIIAASWSGGKDGCFACYKAVQQGHKVSYLVNFISQEYRRVSFHGTPANLVAEQAKSMHISLLQKETATNNYEEKFKEAVGSLVEEGVEGMVFGDIYLQEHRDWVERVCSEIGIEPLEPLWKINTEDIFTGFLDSGFEAMVVSAKSNLIERKWLGHNIDREFLEYLKSKRIDACGENGEYHTFVTNGPLFRQRIKLVNKGIIQRNDHWFVDISSVEEE